MNGKRQISNSCMYLLIIAVQVILLVQESEACLWCNKRQEERFVNCLFIDVVNNPEFLNAPVSSVDEMKWSLLTTSDALKRTPNNIKWKLMDNLLVEETSKLAATLSHYSGNPYDSVLETVVQLSGNCFTAATGINSAFFKSDLKQLVQDYNKKNDNPFDKAPNTAQNDGSNNQNQPLPNSKPQLQPSFNPHQPPSNFESSQPNFGNNRSPGEFGPNQNGPEQNPINLNQYPANIFPPVPSNANDFQPANDFSKGNKPNFNREDVAPNNRQINLNDGNGIHPTQQPSNRDVYRNNPAVPNPNTRSSPSDSSKISTTNQENSKTSNKNSGSSGDSTETSPAPKKEESGKVDEETCSIEFRKALYERLVNDTKFTSVYGVVPYSSAKSLALQATKDAFNECGAPKQGNDFATLWTFESKSIPVNGNNKNYAEVLSKTIPIIFTRSHLLKEDDCEGQGKMFAEYILKEGPERSNNSPSSTTGKPTIDSNKAPPSPESNSDSSNQNTKSTNTDSNSPPDEAPEVDWNQNSRKSKHHRKFSFGQFLKELFGADNSTNEDTSPGNTPIKPTNLQRNKKEASDDSSDFENDIKESLSNTRSDYETIKNLKQLVSAAKKCVTPTGFDYNKLMTAMSEVTNSIQKEHPNWSKEKCQRKMYSLTVVAMSHALQELSSNKDDTKEKPLDLQKPGLPPNQPNNLQDSDFNPTANKPPNFNNQGFIPTGDSTNFGPLPNNDNGFVAPPAHIAPPPAQMNTPLQTNNAPVNYGPETPANNQFNNNNMRNFGQQNNPEYNTRFEDSGSNANNPPTFGIQPYPMYQGPEHPPEVRPNPGNTFDSNFGNSHFENNQFPANNPPVYENPNYEPAPLIPRQNDQQSRFNQNFNSGFPNANPNPGIQAPQTGGWQV